MAIDILESKVVGTNKETWYKFIGTPEDTKPTGEFPAGTGHTVAKDSTYFEIGTQIRYEFDGSVWNPKGQVPTELQDKTVTPTTEQQTIQADDGYDGLDTVTVEAVTAAIDANIAPQNIVKNKTILGVAGIVDSEFNAYYSTSSSTPTGIFRVVNDLLKVHIPEGNYKILTQQSFNYYGTRPPLTEIFIPSTITSIDSDTFSGMFTFGGNIIIDKPEGSIEGAPWGATNATVTWTG